MMKLKTFQSLRPAVQSSRLDEKFGERLYERLGEILGTRLHESLG